MKQIKIKSYGLLAALILLTVSLTSCDEPDQYYSDNLLTYYGWELVAVNGVPVAELDVCEFQFYDFETGPTDVTMTRNSGTPFRSHGRWCIAAAGPNICMSTPRVRCSRGNIRCVSIAAVLPCLSLMIYSPATA